MLIAAAHAFADRGYHATTTRDIASLAGMSPAAVYIHYRSKEELLFQISKIGHELSLAVLTDVSDEDPSRHGWRRPSRRSRAGTRSSTRPRGSCSTNWAR